MARTILDDGLKRWEAFASTGRYGFSPRSQVVFQCTSDPWERPRAFTIDGDKSDAETMVSQCSPKELADMLEGAQPVS